MSAVATYRVLVGDALEQLRTLPDASVQCVVTSPPYFGLRDYGVEGQMGLEPTPETYVQRLVEVFREVRRVLRDDGAIWLNLGDSFAGSNRGVTSDGKIAGGDKQATSKGTMTGSIQKAGVPNGLKSKDLIGIPWRVAFALQADGWWLRSDIVWEKPNPMPESVQDRPTRSHEYIFLLAKAERYYYDADAIREPAVALNDHDATGPGYDAPGQITQRGNRRDKQRGHGRSHAGFNDRWDAMTKEEQQAHGRNKRDVWTVATQGYAGAHFAVFPEKLIEPMILAGCPVGGTVLDPFAGSGTTLAVANRLGRHAIGIELNPQYVALIHERCQQPVWIFEEASR